MERTEISADLASNRNARLMAGFYGIAVFLFCFIGLIGTGIAAYGSESDGVLAAKILSGPASFALVGLVASVVAMFYLKGKDIYQIIVPLVCSMVAGIAGVIFTFIFFEVIWRML